MNRFNQRVVPLLLTSALCMAGTVLHDRIADTPTCETLDASGSCSATEALGRFVIDATDIPARAPATPSLAQPSKPENKSLKIVPGTLYWLGDSLTEGMQLHGNLDSQLASRGWSNVKIQAACGRPLIGSTTYESCEEGRPELLTGHSRIKQPVDSEFIAKSEVVVVALGTNDYTADSELFLASATQLIQEIRAINQLARIVWPTIYVARSNSNHQNLNAAIIKLKMQGVEIARYDQIASPYYQNSDGAHPNADGFIRETEILAASLGMPRS